MENSLLPPLTAVALSLFFFWSSDGLRGTRGFSPRFASILARSWKDYIRWAAIVYCIALGPSFLLSEIGVMASIGMSAIIGIVCGVGSSESSRNTAAGSLNNLAELIGDLTDGSVGIATQTTAVPTKIGSVLGKSLSALMRPLETVRNILVEGVWRQELEEIASITRDPHNRGPIMALYEEEISRVVEHQFRASSGSISRGGWIRLGCLDDRLTPSTEMKVHALMNLHGAAKVRKEVHLVRVGRREVRLDWAPGSETEKYWKDRDWFRLGGGNNTEQCRQGLSEFEQKFLADPATHYIEALGDNKDKPLRRGVRCVAEKVKLAVQQA